MTFSIVTVTYNAEGVLKRTLESVMAQTYQRVEHIIIDGASHDRTLEMARTYSGNSAKECASHEVRIFSEPDNGIYDAMNKGLEKAAGDYILFLNAGDTFASSATLEIVADTVKNSGVLPAVVYGDTDIIGDDGRKIGHRRLSAPDVLTWRSFRKGMLVCHQAFYARLDLARDIKYNTRYRHSADIDWCIRVMKVAEQRRLSLLRVPCVVALFLEGGNTARNHRASLKERFNVMRRHYGLLTTIIMHLWFLFRRKR